MFLVENKYKHIVLWGIVICPRQNILVFLNFVVFILHY